MKTNILLLLIWAACEMTFAQAPADPVQSIRELKDGVLVVRLRTQSNKIASLKEYIAKEPAGSPTASRLAAQLKETEEEVATENRMLATAFREVYQFSEVLFVADTLAPRLKEENPGAIFLNDALTPDPSLSIDGRPFLVAGMGTADPSTSALSSDALIMYDRNFNTLPPPFPGVSGVTGIRMWWKSFSLDEEELQQYFYGWIVERMDRRLKGYFEKTTEAGS